MIPETAGALLAFLGLVAPGLVFELRRERFRPQSSQSAFREASRVALTSLVLTAAALAVAVPLSAVAAWLPDIGEWLAGHSYLADHYGQVLAFCLLVVGLSTAFAVVGEWATRTDRGHIDKASVYYAVLRRDVPAAAVRVWVWVTTTEGEQFKGPLRMYDADADPSGFSIALGGSPLLQRPGTPAGAPWTEISGFDAVVLSGSAIQQLMVSYLDASGQTLSARAPTTAGWRTSLPPRLRARWDRVRPRGPRRGSGFGQ